MKDDTIVLMKDVNKEFPGVKALQDVNMKVKKGEIKALVGENGAGKSTLIKILTGAYELDRGEIYINGKKIDKMNPSISEHLGITAVYQNLFLADHLSVAENIFLGDLPTKHGYLNRKSLIENTVNVLEQIGYANLINPYEKVGNLSASMQGMIAVARALSRNANIIIFDEPTAVLASHEVEELFRVIKWFKKTGRSVIYISHRLEEIFELADSVLVLKDGETVYEKAISETNIDELISKMVGRKIDSSYYDHSRKLGKELLKVEKLTNDKINNCSFSLRSGEIMGVYGLVGSGRTELSRAIFGADPIVSGNIYIDNQVFQNFNPRSSINLGMSLIPEDRRRDGLLLKLSVKHNINMSIYGKLSKLGFINLQEENNTCKKYIQDLSIKTPSMDQIIKYLSGGNQQKVVVAKWLASKSKIFIMDEPTNGIDVGTKGEIYNLMNELARQGAGIIFISTYMPELMSICNRILIMRKGTIICSLDRKEFNEEKILSLAIKNENYN